VTRRLHFTLAFALLIAALGAVPAVLRAQDFVLKPGDAVRLSVPREQDLTGNFEVDLQSVVTFPLIGRVEIAGRPWSQVSAQVMTALRRELREPGITLTPLRRVYVLGAVNKPGSYFLEPTMTLSGAIAAASGAVAEGTSKRVRISRGGSTFDTFAPEGTQLSDIPVESGDRIFVMRRGWLERNGNFLASAILSLTGIIVAIARM
jgi:polysaccharide export outer membrane protein